MAATALLYSSGLTPDRIPFWIDASYYATQSGQDVNTLHALGNKFLIYLQYSVTDDEGWTLNKDAISYPVNTGYTSIAPTVVHAPEIHADRFEVGYPLNSIMGRADSWPSAWWEKEWYKDGVLIEDWQRDYYVPTEPGDYTVKQTWHNDAGDISSTSTAVTVVDGAVVTPTGTARYVKPTASGSGDGSSWANALAIGNLNRALREVVAAGGDTVLVAAELGNYPESSSLRLMSGPVDESGRVTIVAVNSSTGKRSPLTFNGTRSALVVGPRSLKPGSSRGASFMRWSSLCTSYAANATTDVLTVSAEFYAGCETGDGMSVTFAPGGVTVPAPLVIANAVYFVIKTGTANQIKLASTHANAISGTAIDLTDAGSGTQWLYGADIEYTVSSVDTTTNELVVPSGFYDQIRTGELIYIRTDGTYPAGLDPTPSNFLHSYACVKSATANRIQVALDPLKASGNGSGTPIVFDLTTTGTGTLVVQRATPPKGLRYVTFDGLFMNNMGDGGVLIDTPIVGVTAQGMVSENNYRLFENNTHCSGQVNYYNISGLDLTLKDIHTYGSERGTFRLVGPWNDSLWQDMSHDGRRVDGDHFPDGFSLNPWYFAVTQTLGMGEIRYHYLRCQAKRIYNTYNSTEYWNGDGFEDNTEQCLGHYEWCEASWCNDGGFDCKSSGTVWDDCLSAFCKRNYRLWGLLQVLNRCWSLQPQAASASVGDTGGPCHAYTVGTGASHTFNDCFFREAGTIVIIDFDDGYSFVTVFLNDYDIINRPDYGGYYVVVGASSTLTFNPPL